MWNVGPCEHKDGVRVSVCIIKRRQLWRTVVGGYINSRVLCATNGAYD